MRGILEMEKFVQVHLQSSAKFHALSLMFKTAICEDCPEPLSCVAPSVCVCENDSVCVG